MKTRRIFVFLFILITAIMLITAFMLINCNKSPTDAQSVLNSTTYTGEYLGQTPPGTTPEKFVSGIFSVQDFYVHSSVVFSPDKSEVFWSVDTEDENYFQLYFMRTIDEKWTTPEVAPFAENFHVNINRPVFSMDGNKLFFDSEGDIWVVDKQGGAWTEAVKISQLINSDRDETVHSITENGSIYFTRFAEDESIMERMEEIYVSRKTNGNYTQPEKLENNINSDNARELAVFVAADESYMIIEETKDSRNCELFISYKMKNGFWSERINLSLGWARFPSVSPDGKYLFFMKRDGIYWVSTSFIENLKPDELKK